eukprot:359023-Chlamydomonas_euryale.AAC.3
MRWWAGWPGCVWREDRARPWEGGCWGWWPGRVWGRIERGRGRDAVGGGGRGVCGGGELSGGPWEEVLGLVAGVCVGGVYVWLPS